VAGGVIGAVALTGGASPSFAAPGTKDQTPNEITQALDLSKLRAAEATASTAFAYELQATRDQAQADASTAAREHKAAEDAAQAAAQARQAASRAAQRPSLSLPSTASSAASTVTSTASGTVGSLLGFLHSQVGKAYVMGATGPSAYDCSGLTQAAFRTIGVDLPRTSESQSTTGTPVSLSSLQPGDLLFWGGRGSAYHVGVYLGGGQFLAAQNPSKGIVIEPMSYDQPDYATRVL
jgi:cell wall-associated NlpC family hydrolase